jgi:perosamine synthetase
MSKESGLAINGGVSVRSEPMPSRQLIGEEEKAAVIRLFDEAISAGEAFGYNGAYEQQYERDFAEFMDGGFADGVNSGTNAVFVALGALRLDALSEVIVPAITDPGGIMPVVMMGCVPVVADTDSRTYNVAAEEIEAVVSEKTRAIIVAHIGGEPVDMDPVIDVARRHDLYLIEDCAQSHGATYKGRLVGAMGDISTFSTMFSKHHCTGAQGGVVYTRNEDLYWHAKRFADRGKPFNIEGAMDGVHNMFAGLNCNSNDLSAAIGIEQLRKLPGIIDSRHRIGEAIKDGLEDCETVSVGWQVPESRCVYWFIRMKLDLDRICVDKKQFCDALKAEGVPASWTYRYIPYESPWFKNKAVFGETGFPWHCSDYKGDKAPTFTIDNATKVTDSHFNMGINEQYGQKEIDDILAAIKKVEKAYMK